VLPDFTNSSVMFGTVFTLRVCQMPMQPKKGVVRPNAATWRWSDTTKMLASKLQPPQLPYATHVWCMVQLCMYRVPASDPRVWITTVSGPAGT